jgi:hypothetical protein
MVSTSSGWAHGPSPGKEVVTARRSFDAINASSLVSTVIACFIDAIDDVWHR